MGSTITITNASGNVVQHFTYDPWGKQNAFYGSSHFADYSTPAESKGYTGHKMMNDIGIIHMNGRIYDPTLGRFLQADPHIQAPMNSQSYNRYSYVLNNPMSYTDPSGYFFKKLFKGIKKYWRVIAAAAISIATYGTATGWAAGWLAGTSLAGSQIAIGAIAGGITGFVGGGVASGSLRGALNGALSGAAFGAVGGSFKAYGVESVGAQMGAHAVVGGIISDLQGGKFGHGFFTAGVMKGFGKINFGDMNVVGRTVIQAMVGGTMSRITGGKFANGAVTAAIQFVVNEKSGWIQKQWSSIKRSFSIIGNEGGKYINDVQSQFQSEIQHGADRLVAKCGTDSACLDNIKTTSRLLNGVSGTTDALGGIVKAPHLKRGFKLVSSVSGNLSDALDVSSAALEQKMINLVPAAAGNGLEQMINTSPGNLKYGGAMGAAFNEATNQYLDRTSDQ
nr:RHS repeat-associated core domain-containing protein [Alteromonas sp. ASW11-130]